MPRYKVTVCKRFYTRSVELHEVTVEVEAPDENRAALAAVKRLPKNPYDWDFVEEEDSGHTDEDSKPEVVEVEEITENEEEAQ